MDFGLLFDSAIKIFVSYSHCDEKLMQELVKHLSLLKRQGLISEWHDRQITAGSEWEGQISEHLNSAQIILLLISSDFLASDYCYDIELTRAMERHDQQQACVVPVILRPVDWQHSPFSKLQALPKNAQPIISWSDRDEAFLDVAQGIRQVAEQMRDRASTNIQADDSKQWLNPASDRLQSPLIDRLSITQKRRLEQRQNLLQSELNLRNEKLARLRTAFAIEASETVKFQLEKQIQAEEAKLTEISDELDKIERLV